MVVPANFVLFSLLFASCRSELRLTMYPRLASKFLLTFLTKIKLKEEKI